MKIGLIFVSPPTTVKHAWTCALAAPFLRCNSALERMLAVCTCGADRYPTAPRKEDW